MTAFLEIRVDVAADGRCRWSVKDDRPLEPDEERLVYEGTPDECFQAIAVEAHQAASRWENEQCSAGSG